MVEDEGFMPTNANVRRVRQEKWKRRRQEAKADGKRLNTPGSAQYTQYTTEFINLAALLMGLS